MKIWICIPVFNRVGFTLKCLESLNAQLYRDFTIVVCDHGSTDGTTERIKQDFPDVIVINADSSLWWTGAMNLCVDYVMRYAGEGDYLLTLNNDTELPPDYLSEFKNNLDRYPRAVLTSVICDIKSGKQVSVGHRLNWLTAKVSAVSFDRDHLPEDECVVEVTHASGRGTLFPVAVFRKLGLYDERHLPHYAADYDFSQKARRAGFPLYVCSSCKVLSYVDANGMSAVRDRISVKGFWNYLTNIKSPANLKTRWWYAWNNCPKWLFPSYILLDVVRTVGSYFKYFLVVKP